MIEGLLHMLDERERAVRLFIEAMQGHPTLLRSHATREFLYYGMHKNFGRLKPFVQAMMTETSEEHQQRGAELACIAAISPLAIESPEEISDARRIAADAAGGLAPWRRGAGACMRPTWRDNRRTIASTD